MPQARQSPPRPAAPSPARRRAGAAVLAALPEAARAVSVGGAVESPWLWSAALALAVGVGLYGLTLRRRVQRLQAELRRSEAEWANALEFAEDALYLVDLDGRLARGNQRFYDYIGRRPEEAVGQPIACLMHGEGVGDEPCAGCRARAERRDTVFVKEADDPLNRLGRPVEVTVRIVRDAGGTPVGVLQVLRDLSRQRGAEAALRESEARFRTLAEATFEGVALYHDGTVVDCNRNLAAMLRLPAEELIGRNAGTFLCVGDEASPPAADFACVRGERADGESFPAELRSRALTHRGREIRVLALRDVSRLREVEAALAAEKEQLAVTLESIGEGVVTTDETGAVRYLNPVAEQLTGWASVEAHGRPVVEVLPLIAEGAEPASSDPVAEALRGGRVVSARADLTLTPRNGRRFAVKLTAAPLRDRAGRGLGAVVVVSDVTEMREMARLLSYQANHDDLTGLINRREFERRVGHALRSAGPGESQHVLCYLDLDQFKVVNDTCGHVAGDTLLKQLIVVLEDRLRDSDVLARLGGDEFGVLLYGCPLQKAEGIAEALRRAVADFRFSWEGREFPMGVSVGLVALDPGRFTVAEVLRAADSACYAAKDAGRNRVHVFRADRPGPGGRGDDEVWVRRLARAREAGRLALYCQRITPLGETPPEDRPYELLLRLRDEAGGIVPPMAFIPVAERHGVMADLDRWVVDRALRAWSQLPVVETEGLVLSLNVSAQSIADGAFLEDLAEALARTGTRAHSLCFELTETTTIADFARARRFAEAVKAMGCRVALDHFGSGGSSFAYLRGLPLDYVKVDGGFGRQIERDTVDHALVESINQVGHVMGIRTIAQGVESQTALERFEALGVDYAQGYVIERPAAFEETFPDASALASDDAAG